MTRILLKGMAGIFLLALFWLPSGAVAQERIELGPMRVNEGGGGPTERNRWDVTTTLSLSGRYDDNYFRTEDNEHSVYTFTVSPGIAVDYETAKSIVSATYSLNLPQYQDRDDGPEGTADDDDYVGHTFNLNIQTSPTPKLTFRIEDELNVTREPDKADRFANEFDRDQYFVNRLFPSVSYRFSDRFHTALSYRSTVLDYDRKTDQDSVGHTGIWQGFYDVSPTTSIGLNYQYSQRDYDLEGNDYVENRGSVTFNTGGKFITLEAGAGYHRRDFDTSARSDEDGFNYRLALIGQTESQRSFIRLAFGQDFNESGIRDDFFEALQFELAVGRVFRERLRVELAGVYLNADYPQQTELLDNGGSVDREDDRYGLTASMSYQLFDWLGLSLSGGYETRDSNLPNFDFDNTYVQLMLNTSYGLGR